MELHYSVVMITAPDKKTAEQLAEGLVSAKLAACVNIVPGIRSVYWWEEKVEKSDEFLLIAKSRRALTPEIVEFVKRNHPAEVPETIAFPIEDGAPVYLDWVGANTLKTKPKAAEGPMRT